MIDLSYKPKSKKVNDEPNRFVQGLILAGFAAFLTVIILSGFLSY